MLYKCGTSLKFYFAKNQKYISYGHFPKHIVCTILQKVANTILSSVFGLTLIRLDHTQSTMSPSELNPASAPPSLDHCHKWHGHAIVHLHSTMPLCSSPL